MTGSDSYVGVLNGFSSNEAPLSSSDGPINLAPLGDYGGPTQTMIPLPGSPAIDPTSSIARSTDQRGFPITDGSPDIGAVEFRGTLDILDHLFDLDSDEDGSSNGVELALGTDPFVSDPGNERNLRLPGFTQAGQPTFTFGVDTDQRDDITLRLFRSLDLIVFEEIASNEDSTFSVNLNTDLSQFTDSNPPTEGKAFYRLDAVRRLSP